MFAKLVIAFVALAHMSNGLPLEKDQPAYDVRQFFSSRIVGGVDAPEGYSKHMVALVSAGSFMRLLVCGGSIITERHVLSAAHCIEPFVHWGELTPNLIGVVGSNYWNSTEVEIRFSGYKNHPEWDFNTIKNDIGFLITTKAIKFSARVGKVALNWNWMSGGQRASVAGWGRLGVWEDVAKRLQVLYVYTLTPEECFKRMKEAAENLGKAPPVDPKIEICTLHSPGHGMCNGDSGSALVLEGKKQQIGIVSWGYACAHGAPDIFTRMSGFKDFVLPVLKNVDHI